MIGLPADYRKSCLIWTQTPGFYTDPTSFDGNETGVVGISEFAAGTPLSATLFPMVMHTSPTNGKQTDLGQIPSHTACIEWLTNYNATPFIE